MNRFTAVAAFMGEDTGDGRVVRDLWFRDDISITNGQRLIGRGNAVAVTTGHQEMVLVYGQVDLEPGVYPIGMDLDQVDAADQPNSIMVMTGRLCALSVLDADATPSWNCHMVVRAERS